MHTVASEPSAPPPTALPSTEVVPPSELPPTHEVPSNILTPTLTAKASRLSWADIARPTAKTDTKHGFEDLITVLDDLSANGSPRPRFSIVDRLFGDRKSDALETVGVTQFKAYLQLAESAGVVTLEQHQDGDGWVTLRHRRNTSSDGPSQPTSVQHARSRFRDLIKILNELRLAEDPEPRFTSVGPLLRKNPSVYEDAGVTKFTEYVKAAAEAGVVTVRGMKGGDGWLKLLPAHTNPPVHPPTFTSTASTPPACVAETTPHFAPLVNFLESKQLGSAQPVPFSDIFSHFISTLGYPDLVSLYTGVPGVTTFSQYIDAAITSGLVSLVSGTTASRDALISLRDTKPSPSVGLQPLVPIKPTTPLHAPFEPLTSSLTKLWREGKREPMLSEIYPLVLAQDTMAYGRVGATTIKDYVIKAAEADLVIYNPLAMPGVPFMTTTTKLREPPQLPGDPSPPPQPTMPSTPLSSLPSPQEVAVSPRSVKVTPTPFQDLIAVLTKLHVSTGESESRFSSVVPLLLARRPDAYASVGVTKFKDYITLAMKNGVVRIRWNGKRDGWVSLSSPGSGGVGSASTVS